MYFQFKDRKGRSHKINLLGDPAYLVKSLEAKGCTDIRYTLFVYTGV